MQEVDLESSEQNTDTGSDMIRTEEEVLSETLLSGRGC